MCGFFGNTIHSVFLFFFVLIVAMVLFAVKIPITVISSVK